MKRICNAIASVAVYCWFNFERGFEMFRSTIIRASLVITSLFGAGMASARFQARLNFTPLGDAPDCEGQHAEARTEINVRGIK
jgi:hypothetical protein